MNLDSSFLVLLPPKNINQNSNHSINSLQRSIIPFTSFLPITFRLNKCEFMSTTIFLFYDYSRDAAKSQVNCVVDWSTPMSPLGALPEGSPLSFHWRSTKIGWARHEPLFLAADKYQIEALKDLCEQSLISKLNLESVIHCLVVAHLHSAPQLLEASLKFLVSRKTEIWRRPEWKELMKTYPDLFFLASHRTVGWLKLPISCLHHTTLKE